MVSTLDDLDLLDYLAARAAQGDQASADAWLQLIQQTAHTQPVPA